MGIDYPRERISGMRAWTWFCLSLSVLASATQALQATGFFPADAAVSICPDTPLRIHFDQAFVFRYQGTIKIYEAAGDRLVHTLDLNRKIPASDTATQWPFQDTIQGSIYNVRPVLEQGRDAVIPLPRNLFRYGVTYYAVVESGIFRDGGGESFAAVAAGKWSFTIKDQGPKAGAGWSVAADGSGDFCTVQGALDRVPDLNNAAQSINVKAGTYEEIIHIGARNRISLLGQGQDQCIVTYKNNSILNAGTHTRAVFTAEGDDLVLRNFSVINATPKGGSQAECLALWGERCTVDHCVFSSFQDTLLINGRAYFLACRVEGDVDFIWGAGAAFFDQCEIKSLNKGYIVQARNLAGQRGYVFLKCTLTAATGVSGVVLARTAGDGYPYSEAVYIECKMGSHLTAAAWEIDLSDMSHILFGEYGSLDASGKALSISQRATGSKRLTAAQADKYRSAAYVLGGADNWVPSIPVGMRGPGIRRGDGAKANPDTKAGRAWGRLGWDGGSYRPDGRAEWGR
jgi:pectin methylesterase-like acyl-CoA thioesterase